MKINKVKFKKNSFRHLPLALATSALTLSSAVHAQIEEIIVTAERRVGDIQEIPISISAFNSTQLEDKSVTEIADLQYAAPGLSVVNAGISQRVNIRGVGLASSNPNATNGVSIYIDGIFQPPIVNTLSFFDIDNVQILRGAQGTFSGANSTGGAIEINSRRPDVNAGTNGYIDLGLGNYSNQSAEGAVGFAISDTVAVRAAVNLSDRDSFYDDIGPVNTDAGKLEESRARLGITWQPTENLDFFLKYSKTDLDSGGFPLRPIGSPIVYQINFNTDTQAQQDDETWALNTKYTLDNGVQLEYIGGMQEKIIANIYDLDLGPVAPLEQSQYIIEKVDTHELTLVSPTDAALQWVAGYYMQDNDIRVDIQTPGPRIIIGTVKETQGLFGQMGYYFAEDIQVELGLRKIWYEGNDKPGSGGYFGPITGTPAIPVGGAYEDDSMVGKLSVNWFANSDNLLYASLSKGWKPGGYNNPDSSMNFAPEEVDSFELGWKTTAMNGQLRGSFNLFYNDYSSFQFDNVDITSGLPAIKNVGEATIKGFEISLEGQFDALRVDAGFSYVDSQLSPANNIVNTRTLPGEAGNTPQCVDGTVPPACFDYSSYILSGSGGANLYAPENSFSAGIEYAFSVMNGATLTPRLNYGWVDEQWINILYEATDLLDSRGLVSAMLTLQKDSWRIQAYGRNLSDKKYITGSANGGDFYGAPREYGMKFSYDF